MSTNRGHFSLAAATVSKTSVIIRVLKSDRRRQKRESEGNVKNSQGDAALLPWKTEVENHEPRAVGGLSKLEETRKWTYL